MTNSINPPENIIAITQARMGSSRLPGKILLEAAGKPLLEHHLKRVARSLLITKVVVATTTGEEEQPIINLAIALDSQFTGDPATMF